MELDGFILRRHEHSYGSVLDLKSSDFQRNKHFFLLNAAVTVVYPKNAQEVLFIGVVHVQYQRR